MSELDEQHMAAWKTRNFERAMDSIKERRWPTPEEGQALLDIANAANDLYAACKSAWEWSCERAESKRKWTNTDQRVHDKLEAALRKAEGK